MGRLEPGHSDSSEITQQFRAHYGQLCMMTAKALWTGHSAEHVTEAARGQGAQPAPVYVALRRQRLLVDQSLVYCNAAGVDLEKELLLMVRHLRKMASSEWDQRLPMFSESAANG